VKNGFKRAYLHHPILLHIHVPEHELKRELPQAVQKRGFTFPGYNFCGPGNSLYYLPTSMIDAFCQYHDMEYAYRPSSLEIEDDKQFKHMLVQWATASIGDGWTGPTPFERLVVVPMILETFNSKEIATATWAKLLIPSNVLTYMTQFKHYAIFFLNKIKEESILNY